MSENTGVEKTEEEGLPNPAQWLAQLGEQQDEEKDNNQEEEEA